MEEYMCWYAHEELFVPYETMVERMVELTFSASNVYGVETDNSNPYRTIVMDAMRIN
jgi:hypothetical protein